MWKELPGICGLVICFSAQAGSDASPPAAVSPPSHQNAPAAHCQPGPDARAAPGKGACFSNLGSSYDGKQLNATGASKPGDALHLLDPSVTIHK